MGIVKNFLNSRGYLHKSELPSPIVMRTTNFSSTPYAPTIDILTDILEFNRSKIQNYPFAELSKNTPIVRTIQNKIAGQTFKEGFLILSDYVKN